MTARLLTAEQVAETFGIPSPRTVRTMRADGLPAVRLGKCYLYDPDDVRGFIQSRKETKCRDRTGDHISPMSAIGAAGTFDGAKPGAPASSALALEIAAKLKTPLPPSFKSETERATRRAA